MHKIGFTLTASVLIVSLSAPTGLLGSSRAMLFDKAVLDKAFEVPGSLRAPTSQYDDLIRKHAQRNNLDWRLILAIVHTESNFKDTAVSPKGAKGLMQIMPIVAKSNGVQKDFHPDENISAGVQHLAKMRKKLLGVNDADQLKLFIAAYNSGLGHLRDAQNIVIKMGKNPRRWKNVSAALLLLEKAENYKIAKYGYCKGSETVNYVSKVTARYARYQAYYPKNSIVLTKATKKTKNSNV